MRTRGGCSGMMVAGQRGTVLQGDSSAAALEPDEAAAAWNT